MTVSPRGPTSPSRAKRRSPRIGLAFIAGIAALGAIAAGIEHAGKLALARVLEGEHFGFRTRVAECRQAWTRLTCEDVEVRGRGRVLQARQVELELEDGRLLATLHGASLLPDEEPRQEPQAPSQASSEQARTRATEERPNAAPSPAPLPIGLTLKLADPLPLTVSDDVVVTLESTTLWLERDRAFEWRGAFAVTHAAVPVVAIRDAVVRGQASTPSAWTGSSTWQTGDGAAVGTAALAWDAEALRVIAHDQRGGTLELVTDMLRHGRKSAEGTLALRFRDFDADALPTPARGMVASRGVDIEQLRIDGSLIVRREHGWHVRAEQLALEGLRVSHPKIAAQPLQSAELVLDGALHWQSSEQATLRLDVRHEGVTFAASVERTPSRLVASLNVPDTPCQALLDAVPRPLLGIAAGMKLDGRIAADARIETPIPVRYDLERPEQFTGTLAVNFPFTAACRVTADPPTLDLDALSGRFVHRFVDGVGRRQTKIVGPGAPGFVALSRIPTVANAFVTLEDARFWQHDGFDRKQMERAFWHDLTAGSYARGASTISQQTARSLWLGVERTLARKLQEALLTTRLEARLNKRRILEIYLNILELGPGIHGVEEAAAHYFGRHAHELTPLQAVHLAAMAPAPGRYNERFASGEVDEAWRKGLEQQIRRLRIHGYLSARQERAAMRAPLRLKKRR